ncbi:MAG: rod shape-determining protein MreD [Bacillota bacterium]|nr:rod shape-determining protein MreD [Bacillota bacterium]
MPRRRDIRFMAFFGLLALLLQFSLGEFFRRWLVSPDWVLAVVTLAAIKSGPYYGLGAGAALGFLLDLLSGRWLGLRVLAYAPAAYLVGLWTGSFHERHRLAGFLAGIFTAGFSFLVQSFWITFLGGGSPSLAGGGDTLGRILFTAFWAALLIPYDLGFPQRPAGEPQELTLVWKPLKMKKGREA